MAASARETSTIGSKLQYPVSTLQLTAGYSLPAVEERLHVQSQEIEQCHSRHESPELSEGLDGHGRLRESAQASAVRDTEEHEQARSEKDGEHPLRHREDARVTRLQLGNVDRGILRAGKRGCEGIESRLMQLVDVEPERCETQKSRHPQTEGEDIEFALVEAGPLSPEVDDS